MCTFIGIPILAQQSTICLRHTLSFAGLTHKNGRAGIMVTHDLRMWVYVDRVLQRREEKLVRVMMIRVK